MKQKFWLESLAIVILLNVLSFIPIQSMASIPSDEFFTALSFVESSDRDDAIGDNGRAYGRYQIRQKYLDDANSFAGTSYTLNDMLDPEKAKTVVIAYMNRYATVKRLGHAPTNEDYARIHNGGLNGFKKSATIPYWNKINRAMRGERW